MNFLAPLAAFRSGPSALAQDAAEIVFDIDDQRFLDFIEAANSRADAINNSRRVVAERKKAARAIPRRTMFLSSVMPKGFRDGVPMPTPANWNTGLTATQRREARRVGALKRRKS